MKKYYDLSISKNPLNYDKDVLLVLKNNSDVKKNIYKENIKNVYLLSKL